MREAPQSLSTWPTAKLFIILQQHFKACSGAINKHPTKQHHSFKRLSHDEKFQWHTPHFRRTQTHDQQVLKHDAFSICEIKFAQNYFSHYTHFPKFTFIETAGYTHQNHFGPFIKKFNIMAV